MSFLNSPVQFLIDSLSVLPKGKALDVAAGSGRNTLFLAEHGFAVHAIDRNLEALLTLQTLAHERKLTEVTTAVVDLETGRLSQEVFPANAYDVVLVFFYLYRPLFPALRRTLKPGGMLIYETFLLENHLRFHHPRHREFCLETDELRSLTRGLEVLSYDEGLRNGRAGRSEAFTARLLAQKGCVTQ